MRITGRNEDGEIVVRYPKNMQDGSEKLSYLYEKLHEIEERLYNFRFDLLCEECTVGTSQETKDEVNKIVKFFNDEFGNDYM